MYRYSRFTSTMSMPPKELERWLVKERHWRINRMLEEMNDVHMEWAWNTHTCGGHEPIPFAPWWFATYTEELPEIEYKEPARDCEILYDGFCMTHEWDHELDSLERGSYEVEVHVPAPPTPVSSPREEKEWPRWMDSDAFGPW